MANTYKLSLQFPMQVERKRTVGPGPATSYLQCPRCKSTRVKNNQGVVHCSACNHNAPRSACVVYPKR